MNPPSTLNQELIIRKNELVKSIEFITVQQQSLAKISGSLFIKENDNRKEYYHQTHSPEFKRTYIKRQNIEFAKQLAQKSYNSEIITALQSELEAIENLLSIHETQNSNNPYSQYKNSRKELVNPIVISDEEYAAKWQSIPYTPKPFSEYDTSAHYTLNDERVRSKSEINIANFLKHNNIPYKYECPLKLANLSFPGPIYPDFTILNKRTRKEYYLEHLGSMDDINYITRNLSRFKDYEKNGIILGDKLLITYESSKMSLDTNLLKSITQVFLT